MKNIYLLFCFLSIFSIQGFSDPLFVDLQATSCNSKKACDEWEIISKLQSLVSLGVTKDSAYKLPLSWRIESSGDRNVWSTDLAIPQGRLSIAISPGSLFTWNTKFHPTTTSQKSSADIASLYLTVTPPFEQRFRFSGLASIYNDLRPVVLTPDGQFSLTNEDESLPECDVVECWIGVRSHLKAFLLESNSVNFQVLGIADGDLSTLHIAMNFDGNSELAFKGYLGAINSLDPAEKNVLAGLFYPDLWSGLRFICLRVDELLRALGGLLGSWGLAIVLLALLVRLLLAPISIMAYRVQGNLDKQFKVLNPKLESIKQQYTGAEKSERILLAYEEVGMHPLSSLKSLIGLAIQIPILIAIFNSLGASFELQGVGFAWSADLGRPDAIAMFPFSVPFFGDTVNLMPFLMALMGVLSTVLLRDYSSDANALKAKRRNQYLLVIVFFVLLYPFPFSMVLYWACATFFQFFEQTLIAKYFRQANET